MSSVDAGRKKKQSAQQFDVGRTMDMWDRQKAAVDGPQPSGTAPGTKTNPGPPAATNTWGGATTRPGPAVSPGPLSGSFDTGGAPAASFPGMTGGTLGAPADRPDPPGPLVNPYGFNHRQGSGGPARQAGFGFPEEIGPSAAALARAFPEEPIVPPEEPIGRELQVPRPSADSPMMGGASLPPGSGGPQIPPGADPGPYWTEWYRNNPGASPPYRYDPDDPYYKYGPGSQSWPGYESRPPAWTAEEPNPPPGGSPGGGASRRPGWRGPPSADGGASRRSTRRAPPNARDGVAGVRRWGAEQFRNLYPTADLDAQTQAQRARPVLDQLAGGASAGQGKRWPGS